MKLCDVNFVPALVSNVFCGTKQAIAHYSDKTGADLTPGMTISLNNRGVNNRGRVIRLGTQ